jgi:hypothetical protein
MMAEEKLTMEGLDEIQAEDTPTQEAEGVETDGQQPAEAVDEEGEPSDFMAALNAAMSDEEVAEEPEVEPETDPVGETGETGEELDLSPSSANFKKIKQDRDNARRELEELRKSVEDNKGSSAEVDHLRKERDELSSELKVSAIERHPEFKRKYEEKAGVLLQQAKTMVGVGQGDNITSLMFAPESDERTERLDDIFSELPVSKQARLANIISEMDRIQDERQAELSSASATYDQLMESDRTNRSNVQQGNNKLFDEVSESARNLEMYKKKDGDEEWNNGVEERMALARRIYTGQSSPEELVLASCWAAAAPQYREAYGAQMEVNRRLKAQIKELTGASPSVTADGTDMDSPEDMGFIEALNHAMDE